jgi:NitT/TauT family transport system substrate-binding protein
VLDSYDGLGGPHTQIVLLSSTAFWKKNPRTFAAVRAALEEAATLIAKNPRAAAELYLRSTKGKQSLDEILGEINRPGTGYATEPLRIASFGDFMVRSGSIKEKPASWKDIFFPGPEAR